VAKHKNIIWPTTEVGKYPNYYVATLDTKMLKVLCESGSGGAIGFSITRRKARLLAKRINQCLDETK